LTSYRDVVCGFLAGRTRGCGREGVGRRAVSVILVVCAVEVGDVVVVVVVVVGGVVWLGDVLAEGRGKGCVFRGRIVWGVLVVLGRLCGEEEDGWGVRTAVLGGSFRGSAT